MQLPEKQNQQNVTLPANIPLSWVAKLIEKFSILYGAKFTDQWKGIDPDALKQAWSEELAGYSGDELKHGLDQCKTKQWPPTLPEFMSLCRPEINKEMAYIEAGDQMRIRHRTGKDKWSSPAIYWAASRIGNDIQTQPYQTMKSRWVATLDKVNQEISQGLLPNSVPEKREELPPPGKTSIHQDEAKELIAQAVAGIEKKNDFKDWARIILANPQNYTERSVNIAREALFEQQAEKMEVTQ